MFAKLTAHDWHLLGGTPLPFRLVAGLNKPKYKIIGNDIAGTVEAVGRNVTQFKRDDEVFGEVSRCGFGAYAEYAVARESALARKPANLAFEEAASVTTSGCTALQGLRRGKIRSAQRVLIHGASGGAGRFAVQISKALGAEVTGVGSTKGTEMIHAIGADHVLDYTRVDLANSGQKFDLILAVNGDRSIGEYRRTLTRTGRYVVSGGRTANYERRCSSVHCYRSAVRSLETCWRGPISRTCWCWRISLKPERCDLSYSAATSRAKCSRLSGTSKPGMQAESWWLPSDDVFRPNSRSLHEQKCNLGMCGVDHSQKAPVA